MPSDATAYKIVLSPPTDTDPPTSSLYTWDGVIGINQPFSVITDLPTPYNYGAVGDGVADDTVPIQTWLTAIKGSAGFMRAGNFVVSDTLTINGNTTIYGAGSGAASLAKMPGFPSGKPFLNNANPVASPGAAVDTNIFIYNICIQGSQTDQTAANLINFGGVANIIFRDCLFRFHVNPTGINSYVLALTNSIDVWVLDSTLYGYGLRSATGPDGGGAIYTGVDTQRIHILNNSFRNGTAAVAFYTSYGDVSGNTMIDNMEAAILGTPNFSNICNNKISGVVRQNTSGHGMELAGQSNTIHGNSIDSTDAASIYLIDPVLTTVTKNICRSGFLNYPPATFGGLITMLAFTPSIQTRKNYIAGNVFDGAPAVCPSGVLFYRQAGPAISDTLCEGNVVSGSAWGGPPIDFQPDYNTVAGTNFMVRNNIGASAQDYSTQTINFEIPAATSGGFRVGGVGFKPSFIEFQAVLAVTGTCALSMGQQGWETGWDIVSQTITTGRTGYVATGIFWATDGTDCASGDTAGRTSITIRDQLGHPICMAGATAFDDDGFVITINEAIAAEIHTAGTGYATGDTGTISGGNGDAVYIIAAQSGGIPSAITVAGGSGYTNGATNVATAVGGSQPGSGTGLTVDVFSGSPTLQEVVVNAICHA